MGGSSIIMIKKEAVSHVECGDGSHIFVCQLKIGNVGVLLHPFYVNRFGDASPEGAGQDFHQQVLHVALPDQRLRGTAHCAVRIPAQPEGGARSHLSQDRKSVV